jgi:hypothetical protein
MVYVRANNGNNVSFRNRYCKIAVSDLPVLPTVTREAYRVAMFNASLILPRVAWPRYDLARRAIDPRLSSVSRSSKADVYFHSATLGTSAFSKRARGTRTIQPRFTITDTIAAHLVPHVFTSWLMHVFSNPNEESMNAFGFTQRGQLGAMTVHFWYVLGWIR